MRAKDGLNRPVIADHLDHLMSLLADLPLQTVEAFGDVLHEAHAKQRHIFLAGNGGSAATAAHFANDLVSAGVSGGRRFHVTCLTDNVPLVSALANDLGYENVFVEQLRGVINPGDVLVVFSVKGQSRNVIRAMKYARGSGAHVIALLGADGGPARRHSDTFIRVASDHYGLVETTHLAIAHAVTANMRVRLDEDRKRL